MKLKRAIACVLAFNMLLMCGVVSHAETTGTVVAEENYQNCALGEYPNAVSGVRYTVEKDSDDAENLVGRVVPNTSSSAVLHQFRFDAVSTKLSVAFSIRFVGRGSGEKLKIALEYAGVKKDNFFILPTGISGNKDNPIADSCDLTLRQTGMADGKWHSVELVLDVGSKTYTAFLDGELKTPEDGYYLRHASFENFASGITGVTIAATGRGGNILLDNLAISRISASKEETTSAGGQNALGARLGSSIMFFENSPISYRGGNKGYADNVSGEAIPVMAEGKMFVPLSMIATGVTADANHEKVNAQINKKPVAFQIGSADYQLGQEKKTLTAAAFWKGTAYIPAEDAAKLMGAELYTDGQGLYGLMSSSPLDEKKDQEILAILRQNLNLSSTPKEQADGVPQVFHKSGTVRGGETALLYGWNFDKNTKVEISCTDSTGAAQTQEIEPTQITKNSVKFIVPEQFPLAVYPVTVKNAHGASEKVFLNTADPWWYMADSLQKATPGGWIYIMGDSMAFENLGQLKLVSGSTEIVLPGIQQDEYGSRGSVPETVAPGSYELWVQNGLSGETWHKLDVVEIIAKEDTSRKTVFNVVDYQADPRGSVDSTEAIQNALTLAGSNGGTVYFPRGRYRFSGQLQIPVGVTLEGEGKGLVSLFFEPGIVLPSTVLAATDDFVIKNIDLYVENDHQDILTARNNFKLQNCMFRVNAFYHQVKVNEVGGSYPYPAATKDAADLGFLLYISGSNFIIDHCDLLCSGQVFELQHARNGIISNSVFSAGSNPVQSYGTSKMLWENNTFQGGGLYSNGMMLSLYFNAAATYFNCFKNNTFRDFYGGDREAMTFDGHGTAYLGGVNKTDGAKMTLTEAPHWGTSNKDMIESWTMGFDRRDTEREWHGLTVYILDGKGAGQARNLVACSENNIEVETPWDVVPDESSVISIGKFNGRHIFDNNTFVDIGPSVQLYPPGYECIVSRNNISRSFSSNAGGHITNKMSWGGIRVEPNWFSQFVDNTVEQGNSWGAESFKLQMYGTNDLDNMPIGRGHILKRNVLKNNAYICLQGAVSDIVVEDNKISEAPLGIYLRTRQGNCPQDYVLRGNVFENVDSTVSNGQ